MNACEKLEAELDDFKEKTQEFVTLTGVQLRQMALVQNGHHETLFGKNPPDAANPGIVSEMTFVRTIKKFSWLIASGFASGVGLAIWALV